MKADKVNIFIASLVLFSASSWVISCTHKVDLSSQVEICFEKDVLPIFTNSCAISGCHDGTGEGGRALDNFADISRMVTPGDASASRAYQAITSKWGWNLMPPNQPLSMDNRTIIRLWIEQGAQQTCPAAKASEKIPPESF